MKVQIYINNLTNSEKVLKIYLTHKPKKQSRDSTMIEVKNYLIYVIMSI